MPVETDSQAELQVLLVQLQDGDERAVDHLVNHAYDSLRRLTQQMLHSYRVVHRWEETDDVWQQAAMRFCGALRATEIKSVKHFFALAGLQIRRTLIDLARKHSGPWGLQTNQDTDLLADSMGRSRLGDVEDPTNCPLSLADWSEFHEQVDSLPEPSRQVFDLIWYGGLTPAEAASILEVDSSTIRRRWRHARLLLADLHVGSRSH